VVGLSISNIKKGLLPNLPVNRVLISVNIWQSYKQEGGTRALRVPDQHIATDEESARRNPPFPSNYAKYSPI